MLHNTLVSCCSTGRIYIQFFIAIKFNVWLFCNIDAERIDQFSRFWKRSGIKDKLYQEEENSIFFNNDVKALTCQIVDHNPLNLELVSYSCFY